MADESSAKNSDTATENGEEEFFTEEIDDAWEDFFEDEEDESILEIEEEEDAEAAARRRRLEIRIDKVISTLIKAIISKDRLDEQDLSHVLRITATKVVEAVNALAITIYMLGDDGLLHFQHVYYSPKLWREEPSLRVEFKKKAEQLMEETLEPGEGIVGRAVSEKQSICSLDARHDPNWLGTLGEDGPEFEVRTMMTAPIIVDDEAVGAIQVMNKDDRSGEEFFSQRDLKKLEEVAEYSAKIIFKVRNPDHEYPEEELAQYVARLSKSEYDDLTEVELNDALINSIGGEEILNRYHIIPIEKTGVNSLKVAMTNPLDLQLRETFELSTRTRIEEVVVSTASQIKAKIDHFSQKDQLRDLGMSIVDDMEPIETIDVDTGDDEHSAPIVRLANQIITDAYVQGTSDIHVEPFEDEVIIRYRIDGKLQRKLSLPPRANKALVSRFKIMSELDIAERRLPQDGRIQFKKYNKRGLDVDLRVSVAPMQHGEKICMRLLDKSKSALPLDKLGFSDYNLETYRELIQQPYGMILHCGPTGSGKSMTLFSALGEINSPETNISTAEDPIEYTIKGVNQMQVKKQIGLTFAAALRCFLRQDPDIILVGEIRDQETAEIAIEAALTGHLLFSTLHTNDAPSTVSRFMEMGVEPFMISSSLIMICAQRLLRRVCKECAEEVEPNEQERLYLDMAADDSPIETILKANGCKRCNGVGYKGRTGIHELMAPNDQIREMINSHATAEELRPVAMKNGMRTMFQDCMEKVKAHITSLEESLAVAKPDEQLSGPLREWEKKQLEKKKKEMAETEA